MAMTYNYLALLAIKYLCTYVHILPYIIYCYLIPIVYSEPHLIIIDNTLCIYL